MKSELLGLAVVSFLSITSYANPQVTCKGRSGLHHFTVVMADERVQVTEEWQGAYKASATHVGLIAVDDGAFHFKFSDSEEVTTAKFYYLRNGKAIMDYEGMLPPYPTGQVLLKCK